VLRLETAYDRNRASRHRNQDGASITDVKADGPELNSGDGRYLWAHLMPGADIAWVDRLDTETTPQLNAN
jgi:hypothetical protein